MAGKKYEFRQVKTGPDLLSKLYLTKKQRASLLKWTLFGLVMLALSLIQDVILCHVNIYGASTDLMPYAILLACMILGADTGCVFALVAASFYQFSGTAPGYYTIALIPILGTLMALLRQAYLRKGVFTNIACAAIAFFLYEMFLLGIGIISELTVVQRAGTFFVTFGITLITTPVLYPLLSRLERIGGETWNE